MILVTHLPMNAWHTLYTCARMPKLQISVCGYSSIEITRRMCCVPEVHFRTTVVVTKYQREHEIANFRHANDLPMNVKIRVGRA